MTLRENQLQFFKGLFYARFGGLVCVRKCILYPTSLVTVDKIGTEKARYTDEKNKTPSVSRLTCPLVHLERV